MEVTKVWIRQCLYGLHSPRLIPLESSFSVSRCESKRPKKWQLANQRSTIIISQYMAGEMSANQDIRKGELGKWIRAIPALAALLVLLVARNAPPEFPPVPSVHHTSLNAGATHGHRLQFDCNGLPWSDPVSVFVLIPPDTESAHSSLSPELYSALQLKGFHYNRPPPSS